MNMKRCSLILLALICLHSVNSEKFKLSGNNSSSVFVGFGDLFDNDFNQLVGLSLAVETGPQADYSGNGREFNLKIGHCNFRIHAASQTKGGILFNISASSYLIPDNNKLVLKNLSRIDVDVVNVTFVGVDKDNKFTKESTICGWTGSNRTDSGYIVPIELSGNVPPNFKLTSDTEFYDPTSTSSSTSSTTAPKAPSTTVPSSDESDFLHDILFLAGFTAVLIFLASSATSSVIGTQYYFYRRAMKRAKTVEEKLAVIQRYTYERPIIGCIVKKLTKNEIADTHDAATRIAEKEYAEIA